MEGRSVFPEIVWVFFSFLNATDSGKRYTVISRRLEHWYLKVPLISKVMVFSSVQLCSILLSDVTQVAQYNVRNHSCTHLALAVCPSNVIQSVIVSSVSAAKQPVFMHRCLRLWSGHISCLYLQFNSGIPQTTYISDKVFWAQKINFEISVVWRYPELTVYWNTVGV